MLIFVSGHHPIYGTQILYFSDPSLAKRAAIPPPTEFVAIEDGEVNPQRAGGSNGECDQQAGRRRRSRSRLWSGLHRSSYRSACANANRAPVRAPKHGSSNN